MSEQQGDDFYVPAFLLMLPPKAETEGHYIEEVDFFLKNIEGWPDFDATDEFETRIAK
jgi:hypothetical protein